MKNDITLSMKGGEYRIVGDGFDNGIVDIDDNDDDCWDVVKIESSRMYNHPMMKPTKPVTVTPALIFKSWKEADDSKDETNEEKDVSTTMSMHVIVSFFLFSNFWKGLNNQRGQYVTPNK